MKTTHTSFSVKMRNALFTLLTISITTLVSAQPDIQLKTEIAANLVSPMHLTHAGDGSGRIFVSERAGVVKVFNSSFGYIGEYLNIINLVSGAGEGGLLSIAFHPDFETNHCLFVHYTDKFGNIAITRYQASDAALDAMDDPSPVTVLTIPHPATNHYGGEMHFGSDGNLYISTGDGGGANDVNNNAQDPTKLLGKILRITAATSGTDTYNIPTDNPFPANTLLPRNEVYAIGLRNPFRWSFDSATGDMWIGDVGQGAEEEIDHCPAAMIKGANFGWRCYEGAIRTPAYDSPEYQMECAAYGNFPPRYSYGRNLGQSVIGGVVYHGSRYPQMEGYYIGADYFTGIFHILTPDAGTGRLSALMLDNKTSISDFGEGENGEIYAISMAENSVFRFVDANVDPLPVNLLSFSAKKNTEGIKLLWKTSMEERFSSFDIEYSANGTQFTKVGNIAAANSIMGSEYQFTHSGAAFGTVYYRLKLIDIDGTYTHSKIVSADNEQLADNLALPSVITNGILTVNLTNPYQSFELIGVSGQTLMKYDVSLKSGQIEIPVGLVPAALYVVRLNGEHSVYTQKILISN